MIKGLLLFFILTVTFSASGQETKRVKREEGKVGDLEIFYVLKSDKNIKHGPYERFVKISNPRNQVRMLLEKGQYENNKKTGIWTTHSGEDRMLAKGAYENDLQSGSWEYYQDGVSIEKGNYVNGKRDGLWVHFDKENGILERGYFSEGAKIGIWKYHYFNVLVQTYDHSLDSLLQYYDDGSISEAIIDETNETQEVVLSRPPQYIGHKRQLQRDMAALTKYPRDARINELMGEVIVTFIVNEDGTTSDYAVMQDIGGKCGQAVIEAYKANPAKWIPGIYNGKKVKVRVYQTVNFNLEIDTFEGLFKGTIVYE